MPAEKQILIVDDHPIMRMGLRAMISDKDDLAVIGEAGTANDALEFVESHEQIDLVILDMSLPDRSGLDLIKDLRVMRPEIKCLFISSHDENVYAERVLRAGGRGYVMKDRAPDCLEVAIRTVLKGGVFLSPDMTAKLMEVLAGGNAGSEVAGLTDRELEVYRAIGSGKTSREIADLLGISIRTVDAHRTHIKNKLGLRDAAELNYQAIRWMDSQS
ncbi:MAG: response regulator transcription factor [Verrucomicrobiales bacterium]|nr:response regulator transcription factor [Verrucomicrobiales bacterium]